MRSARHRTWRLETETAWRIILMASLSSLTFKGALVAVIGSRELFRHIALAFGAALAAGGALLWFWPA